MYAPPLIPTFSVDWCPYPVSSGADSGSVQFMNPIIVAFIS